MSWGDIIKGIEFTADDEWQKKLQQEIDSLDYDEVEGEEVLKPENRINPMNTEHMMDIFYLAARQHKGKSITPEHKKMLDENYPILEQMEKGVPTFLHVLAMVETKDEDTDERDERMGYSNDPLHR